MSILTGKIPEALEPVIYIDGSEGEGGGQILRTSLSLSNLLLKPFEISNIRAGRVNPGLQAQHLKAVEASVAISGAVVEGAYIGSTSLKFFPGKIKPGSFRFDIGTAGSSLLVLQTVYLPLTFSGGVSKLKIIGGTHVQWSPTYDYIKLCWLYFMKRIGLNIDVKLERAGFYPHGGGIIEAVIKPVDKVSPLKLTERGNLVEVNIYSFHSNLNFEVAKRQAVGAESVISGVAPVKVTTGELKSFSKGTAIAIVGVFENTVCCYTALGEKGKRAEVVGREAGEKFLSFLKSEGATVDERMSDQIILPLSIADGESEFTTTKITNHLITNANTIKKFLNVEFKFEEFKNYVKIKVIPGKL